MEDPKPTLELIESKQDSYRQFTETKRWKVSLEGGYIGDLWRGERCDGVVCWMQEPKVLGMAMPDSGVVGGYSRTTKKGTVYDLVNWHINQGFSMTIGGWRAHCANRIVLHGEKRDFFAIHEDGRTKWLFASFNEEERPHLGAMGGVGWHVSSRRGYRLVIAHNSDDLEGAVGLILERTQVAPTKEETSSSNIHSLSAERYWLNEHPSPSP